MKIDKDDKRFLELALDYSCFSNCNKVNFGAIIVNNKKEILSKGMNFVPMIDIIKKEICNKCIRETKGIKSGTHVELCGAIHAEQMACLDLQKTPELDNNLILYLAMSKDGKEKFLQLERDGSFLFPCSVCARIMYYAGVKELRFYTMRKGKKIVLKMNIRDVLGSSMRYALINSL